MSTACSGLTTNRRRSPPADGGLLRSSLILDGAEQVRGVTYAVGILAEMMARLSFKHKTQDYTKDGRQQGHAELDSRLLFCEQADYQ